MALPNADRAELVEARLPKLDRRPLRLSACSSRSGHASTSSGLTDFSPIRFAGYAALFDRIDRGGDVIRPGAFLRSLGAGRVLPLLWQHRPGEPVGRVTYVREDRRGLRVIGAVEGDTPAARAAKALLRAGAGLSFGYRVRRANGESLRELIELELFEVSLVTLPMQRLARVHLADFSGLPVAA